MQIVFKQQWMYLWNPTFIFSDDGFYRSNFTLPILYTSKVLINLSNVRDMGAPITAYDKVFVETNRVVFLIKIPQLCNRKKLLRLVMAFKSILWVVK